MSVYVDELKAARPSANWPYKRACHLWADTAEELHEMAGMIGVARSNFQSQADFPHYDLTAWKRRQAIARGAIAVGHEEMVAYVRGKRPYPFSEKGT
jgi:hypothetical protein